MTFAEIPPDPKDYPGALPEMLQPASLVFTPPGRPVDLRNFHNCGSSGARRSGAGLTGRTARSRASTTIRSCTPPTRKSRRTPPGPASRKARRPRHGPRGVLHCWATDEDDKTVHPRWGKVGRQDQGHRPFAQYSTDNGPHRNTWPDAGTTPFRSEKNTNWEGAFRVPLIVRWPAGIAPGQVSNEIVQHHDWLPTFLAMTGAPDVVEKLKKGYRAIGRTYKNHIDGLNLLPYLTGKEKKSPRNFFFYFSDDGDMLAIRMHNWKVVFMEQRTAGTRDVWKDPFVRLRAPNMYNLRTDPFEFAKITSNTYSEWMFERASLIYAVQAVAAKFAETFKDFPVVQKPNTFTVDDALKQMSEAGVSA